MRRDPKPAHAQGDPRRHGYPNTLGADVVNRTVTAWMALLALWAYPDLGNPLGNQELRAITLSG